MAVDERKLNIRLSVEEMGRISIALDAIADDRREPDFTRLKEKWDKLYRGVHAALKAGVVSLDAR